MTRAIGLLLSLIFVVAISCGRVQPTIVPVVTGGGVVATQTAPPAAAVPAKPAVPAAAAEQTVTVMSDAGPHMAMPKSVRGIYLTGWMAGSASAVDKLIEYCKRNNLNAMVIDVKDMDGRLSFPLPGTEAERIGANRDKLSDPVGLIRKLHGAGLYVIGRIVAFADPYLATQHPDWAIRQNGAIWKDRHGNPWIDARNKGVWDYMIQIGIGAAKTGFDEIQYDYIRLPENRLAGYNIGNTAADREQPVEAFLKRASKEVTAAAGVPVSGDVFAIDATAVNPEDEYIGQDYAHIAHLVDPISPMAYPSLYAQGEFGIPNPNARPYDTIWETMASAEARTADLPLAQTRPWIQDYDLGEPHYGPAQVDAELEALAASGIHSFMMWNAGNVYTDGIDFGLIDSAPLGVPNPVWLPASFGVLPSSVGVLLPRDVPPAPQGQAYSLTSAINNNGGYDVGLWATPKPLATNDDGVRSGQLVLAVSGAKEAAHLSPLPDAAGVTAPAADAAGSQGAGAADAGAAPAAPAGTPTDLGGGVSGTLAPAGNGFSLVWQAKGETLRVWARDAATATAAAKSMQALPLIENR